MASDVRYQILIDSRPDLELTGQISEIEVTESVRQPTTARVRFVADVCKADLHLLGDRCLQPGVDKLLSVLVSVDGVSTIISHGVIVDRTFELTEGGPGSWWRRSPRIGGSRWIANLRRSGTRSGKVSSIVRPILQKYKFTPDVDVKEDPNYTPKQQILNQPVTDLAVVRALAGQTGVEFPIDYKLGGRPDGRDGAFEGVTARQLGRPGLLPIKLPTASSTPELKLNSGIGNATLLGFNAGSPRRCRTRAGAWSRRHRLGTGRNHGGPGVDHEGASARSSK